MPLPPVLTGRFATEPKWVDLRAYRDGADPRDARFIEAGADFAAAIHGMPKEDLLSQEVRQQRRALTAGLERGGVAALPRGPRRLAGESRDRQRARAAQHRRAATATGAGTARPRRAHARGRDGRRRTRSLSISRANSAIAPACRATWCAGFSTARMRLQRQLAESGETAPELRAGEALALGDLMDVFLALGDTKAALEAGERLRAIMEALVASDPGNTRWQRDLAAAYERMGGMLLAAGRREEALAEYNRSFAITSQTRRLRSRQYRVAARSVARTCPARRRAGRRRASAKMRWRNIARASRSYRNLPPSIPATPIGSAGWPSATARSAICCWRRGGTRRRWRNIAGATSSANSLPPPIPATRSGSATCRSTTAGSAIYCRAAGRHEERWRNIAEGPRHPTRNSPPAIPRNTQWQRDLWDSATNKIGDVLLKKGGPWDEALAEYPHESCHCREARSRRSRQYRVAARPLDQPQQDRRPCWRKQGRARRRWRNIRLGPRYHRETRRH